MNKENIPGSFRDPSGFIFFQDGSVYRQVNLIYQEDYDHLINSGLYHTLVASKLLIPHEEVAINYAQSENSYKIIKPDLIPFISYPYEWCFSQLKDAALVTLKIQKEALKFGMVLKDSSAYNIQFWQGKPIMIDTLSFKRYNEGEPWVAYKQFCQHFLAPLALMAYTDIRLSQLLRVYIDGLPLDLIASLLPFRCYFNLSLLSHIYLHAKTQTHFADKSIVKENVKYRFSLLSFQGLIDSLESAIQRLTWKPKGTEWIDYTTHTHNYDPEASAGKEEFIKECIDRIKPKTVMDIGANIGVFSRLASSKGIETISFDIDPACVETNYLECIRNREYHLLPLLLDLTNPSSNIGWGNEERMSFLERGQAEVVFALAIIHHLAISNNLPFEKIASFFKKICNFLIIEFVPKNDSQVQKLLTTREDIFPEYTQLSFENRFSQFFTIQNSVKLKNSERVLYLMVKKGE